jgi:hypothetical protein
MACYMIIKFAWFNKVHAGDGIFLTNFVQSFIQGIICLHDKLYTRFQMNVNKFVE